MRNSLYIAKPNRLFLRIVVWALASFAPAVAQTPPNPTADPTTPNIFYGATPTGTAPGPVLLFVHGLKGKASDWWINNDMYSTAYAAGYRTAFVSINPDNSPNDTSWAENGLVLKAIFPKVTAHYGVRNLFVVGHSKGGLDVQAALLNLDYTDIDPDVFWLAKGVFMLGTPNQGTALADWAFGPGQSLAQQFGLQGPGLQSLEVATVQAFRAKADQVFARAPLQFYTFAGDSPAGNPILETTSKVLSGLAAGPNDGLVPVSSVRLPFAYSMDIGETPANHFLMNQGHISFSVVDGPIQGVEKKIYGFRKKLPGP